MLWINLAGLALIGFIVWWFWLYKPSTGVKAADGSIEIHVKDGVYQPARIEIPAGQSVRLRFIREDASPCAETVVFHNLGISAQLPLNKEKVIELKIDDPGEYRFTCQMQMYTGTLVVSD